MDKFPSRERSAESTLDMRVSAVVVASKLRRRPSGQTPLELCLRSLLAESWIDELVVVDHDNAPLVSSWLRAQRADRRDMTLVAAEPRLSEAAAANLGAARARGRWLLFVAPDVVLQRGAAARLAAAGGGADMPWIAGGRLTDTEGKDRDSARQAPPGTFTALAIALGWRARRRRRTSSAKPLAVGAVSDALMLMPREAFQSLSGFDEGYATDAADLDLCRRAREAGGAILFQPSARGVQFGHDLSGRKPAQGLARFAARSAKTWPERAFAAIALPALLTLLLLKDLIAGHPPRRR